MTELVIVMELVILTELVMVLVRINVILVPVLGLVLVLLREPPLLLLPQQQQGPPFHYIHQLQKLGGGVGDAGLCLVLV